MTRLIRFIVLVGVVTTAFSCKRFSNTFAGSDRVLAEVGDERLYAHDIAAVFTPDMSPEDSLKILQSYVDRWIKKQLKIQQAEQMFESSQGDIDRMVREYRNSLMTNKVDQFYVDKRLDTLFTDRQIREYYDQNKADFILDKTLLKARIVRIPRNYDKKKKLKELMLSSQVDKYQDFVDLCVKNGFDLTEMNNWTEFPTLLALLPTDRKQNYDYLLSPEKVHELESDDYIYYVRVLSFRKAGEYAPLESVSDLIRRVIFNKRKEEIIRNYEDSLYRNALRNQEIKVHIK